MGREQPAQRDDGVFQQMIYAAGAVKIQKEGRNMRRILAVVLTVLVAFAPMAACAQDIDLSGLTPEQLQALQEQINAMKQGEETSKTSLEIINAMIELGAPIDAQKLTDYDEVSDPNGQMGKPGGYTSKTDYGCVGYAKNSEGEWVGGTLEVYEDTSGAKNRFDYLESIYTQMPVLLDCHMYLRGNAVLRINLGVVDKDAQTVFDAFETVVDGETKDFNPIQIKEDSVETVAPPEENVPAEENTVSKYTVLKKGDRGAAVAQMQARLKELGFLNDVADGVFGGNTEKAVMAYQDKNGLQVTGIATKEDQEKLFEAGVISANGSVAATYDPFEVCPADISRVAIKSSYGVPYVTFKVTNVSTVEISAINYQVQFFDAFGDRLTGYNGKVFEKSCSVSLTPGKSDTISTRNESEMYDYSDPAYASVAITRVRLIDGTELTYSDPVWFEGK